MNLAPGTRRADDFARLLETPVRTDDPSLAPYVALATALQAVPAAAGPRPEFRDALRQRLLAVATVQGAGEQQTAAARIRQAGLTWNFQRRVAIVAGGAAAATAIAGVGVGASRSLPGDPFYGIKRATERVQLATASGQEAKGKRHLEFARTRLSEVEALVGRNSALTAVLPGGVSALGPLTDEAKASTIISTLQDMDAETRAGAQDLLDVAVQGDSAEPLQALNDFTRTQFSNLRAVLPALPTAARPRATQSLSLLTVVASHSATVARSTPGGGSDGQPGGSTGSGGATRSATPGTPAPGRTAAPSQSQPATGTPTPDRTPSLPGLPSAPAQIPTPVPTIPPLPSVLPLPTSIPTLPDLNLPLLPNADK